MQYGEILTIKDKIYVYLADDTNSDNSATVCINQNTGDVLDVYYGFAGNLMLHNEELIVASYTTVQTLDLGSNRQTKFDFSEILNALNLQILWNKSVVKSNLLYFVDGHWTATNRCGIVDLKNKKMLWHSNIEINDDINNNIQELKVCCNRLYIHCSDNTLHIFEHEY